MKDYYKILGIKRDSSIKDVKKTFRVRAKELHPDLKKADKTDEDMKLLLKAYQVLSNPRKRKEYDHRLKYYYPERSVKFTYREYLKQQMDDLRCQAKLIFYDLLHSREQEALDLYDSLVQRSDFQLSDFLNWGDFMDCSFLLAEQYCLRSDYLKAYELFKQLYVNELRRNYFHHYIEEIKDRLKTLACFNMSQVLSIEENIEYIKELIGFNFSIKHNAYFYKKLSELYFERGHSGDAVACLQMALKLDKNIEGIKNLQKKMEWAEKQA